MSFTCITCRVAFIDPEKQRDHYKSEWHRYNLKRKVAELPPITNEQFQVKESVQKALLEESAKNSSSAYCDVCRKEFSSKNAHLAHLNSKKHHQVATKSKNKMNETKQNVEVILSHDDVNDDGDDDDEEDWESCEGEDADNNCLFCCYESADLNENIRHMTVTHSFFIPDLEYVVNLSGLIAYLFDKVSDGFMCIWCGKEFTCMKSVQKHMMDLGHCKMLHERDSSFEYADFYDYTSSHPERVDRNGNDDVQIDCLADDGWELTLPSGTKVGHRALALYYRQNLAPKQPENVKRVQNKIQNFYKGLSWVTNVRQVKAQEIKMNTYMRKVQAKRALKLGVRNNKLQRHFRSQVFF